VVVYDQSSESHKAPKSYIIVLHVMLCVWSFICFLSIEYF